MQTLLPKHFVLEKVTQNDLVIASLAWGFTLGIGWLTTWSAFQQSKRIYRRHGSGIVQNTYVIMIWGEILVCLAFGIICFMYLLGAIPPSFAFYFCILTLWALQVQFLLQIIINRCAILLPDKVFANRIKYSVAATITAINISVYCIWVPARLQINPTYVLINEYWDRIEKGIYLVVDAGLNLYFIRIVQRSLVELGMRKYRGLVKFNMIIICFSLAMDVLIIATMSLDNTFVYMQFHPLAYIVKLKIELSMADLIAKIAASKEPQAPAGSSSGHYYGNTRSVTGNVKTATGATAVGTQSGGGEGKHQGWPMVTTTIEMHSMDANDLKSADKARAFSHSDTDSLISPTQPYSGNGMAVGQAEGGATRERKTSRGGTESISSFNTDSLGPVEAKDRP